MKAAMKRIGMVGTFLAGLLVVAFLAVAALSAPKTPTLILAGHDDGECPAPQSCEFWQALKTLGGPTEVVVYLHEGHAFVDPAHNRDVIIRSLRRFNSYIGKPLPESTEGK
jgi:dipeptidyl aminopeptidase/acylaminoacyl peptidase